MDHLCFTVLAVSIFSFRKTNLLKVQSYNAAEVSHIHVVFNLVRLSFQFSILCIHYICVINETNGVVYILVVQKYYNCLTTLMAMFQAVLADLTTLQVIPLIQLSLFSQWGHHTAHVITSTCDVNTHRPRHHFYLWRQHTPPTSSLLPVTSTHTAHVITSPCDVNTHRPRHHFYLWRQHTPPTSSLLPVTSTHTAHVITSTCDVNTHRPRHHFYLWRQRTLFTSSLLPVPIEISHTADVSIFVTDVTWMPWPSVFPIVTTTDISVINIQMCIKSLKNSSLH